MISDGQRRIYTIGHSTHCIEDFKRWLSSFEIECLVDVRRFPASRKHPQFAKEALLVSLQAAEIEYVWLGDRLGGFRSGGYEKYTESEAFQLGIEELKALAKTKTTAIMCAELLFFRCHRRFIADSLSAAGWHVSHILSESKVQEHKLRRTSG